MWALENSTPFAAERAWVRDKRGAEVWLVAVKATFAIEDDESLTLLKKQVPVNLAPKFRGDPLRSSLLFDTDLPHCKQSTDVLVDGHAIAPPGKKAKFLNVGFSVGNLTKVLRVFGNRRWTLGVSFPTLTDPEPFERMPVIYERAFGGMDLNFEDESRHDWELRNPAGRGFAKRWQHLVDQPAPNVEYADHLITSWKDRPPPGGFGPVAGHWMPRVALAGTYDDIWEQKRQPLLPEDFDERYHQCAPPDQQVPGFLKGGERVAVYHMTPDSPLKFTLPRVSLAFTTHFDDGTRAEHRAVVHTLTIKPDTRIVEIVWHTHLECHFKVLKLRATSIRLKRRILNGNATRSNGSWAAA